MFMQMGKFIKFVILLLCFILITPSLDAQINDYTPKKGEKLKEMQGPQHIAKGYVKDNKFVDGSPIEIRLKYYRDEETYFPVISGIYKEIDGKSYIDGIVYPRPAIVLTEETILYNEHGNEKDHARGLFQIYNTPDKKLSPKKIFSKYISTGSDNKINIEIVHLDEKLNYLSNFGEGVVSEGYNISQFNDGNDIVQIISLPNLKIQPYKRIFRKSAKMASGRDLENLDKKVDWIIEFENGDSFEGEIINLRRDPTRINGLFIDKDGTKVSRNINSNLLKGEGIVTTYKKIKNTDREFWPDSIIFTDGTAISWKWLRENPERLKIFEGANDTKDLKENYENYLINEAKQNQERERIQQEKINNFKTALKHYKDNIQKKYPAFSSKILNGEIEIGMSKEAVSYSLYFRIVNLFMALNDLGETLNSKTNTFNIENFTFDRYNLSTLYTVGTKTPYSETYVINGTGRFMELPYRVLEFVNGKLYSFSK